MKFTVLIDNGHGIGTGGKSSPDGRYREWEWTRRLARSLKSELAGRGIAAELLVPEDDDVPLAVRCRRANAICGKKSNVILISLHSNASGVDNEWHTPSGWSSWVATRASDESRRLAKLLSDGAAAKGLQGNRATPPCGYYTANLAICRDTVCPAVLTENMFHDNREDVDFLLSDRGIKILTGLHADAITAFCNED